MNKLTAAVIASLATLLFSPETSARTEVFTYVINPIGGFVENKTAATGPISSEKSGSDDRGSGVSRSSADFGVLRTLSEAHANNTGSAFQALSAGAQASFRDDLTINAPGLAGTSGTVTLKFTVEGNLIATGDGDGTRASYADCAFYFRKNDSTFLEDSFLLYYDGTSTGNNFLGQERTVTVPFTFGEPFELYLLIETGARAYNYRGASAIADLENTATWGGFVSVRDSNNNEVDSYTTTSGSGADFSQPILPPSPTLAARKINDSQLQVSWSAAFSEYTLHSSSTLPSTTWDPVQATPTQNGTELSLIVPLEGNQRFFQLRKP